MSKASSGNSRSRRTAIKAAYRFGSDEYVKLQRPEAQRDEAAPQRESSLFQVRPAHMAGPEKPRTSTQDYLNAPRGIDGSRRSEIH